MKKCELLAPAGDMECLKQAVYNGCDAIYLSAQSYGARKFAKNFTNEELVEAIQFAHLYGVRVYVTMNTLIHNHEVEGFLDQVRFLHKNGVDALIMQDFGMICLVREMFPNLEIHASTQANNSSKDTCQLFYDLGVKRVVFSRELSIDEIDSIDVPIEKEAFIHGALCVSYSGCCLMSSMLGGRSGNRGECAGCCRLPYSLLKNGESISHSNYLLSMKELNTSTCFQRLMNSSVYSFKIEGRMKGPLYVGFITRLYRKLIDGEPISLEEKINRLKTIFNRDFTVGHLFGKEGISLINSSSPNHVGLLIGTSKLKGDKIQLDLDKGVVLHQNDAIRFMNQKKGMYVNYLYDEKGKLCSSAEGRCFVDNKIDFKGSDKLSMTQDSTLEKEYILQDVIRRIPVSYHVILHENKEVWASISDGIHEVSFTGNLVSSAINAPINQDMVKKQLSKLGETPFVATQFQIEMDSNIFLSVKELNEIRRELISQLILIRNENHLKFVEKEFHYNSSNLEMKDLCKKSAVVYTEEQLLECLRLSFDRIYVVNCELYEKYKMESSIFLYLERCAFDYRNILVEKNYVQDYFVYKNGSFCGGYGLNVTNIYTAYFLQKLGLHSISLSVELTDDEILDFLSSYYEKFGFCEFESLRYGRVENMIIKGNILGIDSQYQEYEIVDDKKRKFPVCFDGAQTHIYHCDCFQKPLLNCVNLFDFYGVDVQSIESIVKEKI